MQLNVTDSEYIGDDESVRYKMSPTLAMKSNV